MVTHTEYHNMAVFARIDDYLLWIWPWACNDHTREIMHGQKSIHYSTSPDPRRSNS